MSESDAFDRVVERERSHHRRRRWKKSRRILVVHAWIYLAVNLALIAGWTVQVVAGFGAAPWWLPTTIGWGVGLAIHAALVYRPWRRRGGRSQPNGAG